MLPARLWRITLDTNPEDCNLHCIMCEEHSPYSDFIPRLYKQAGVKRRRMPIEWLESIFQQAKNLGVREIIPSTMGEPLLYRGIEQIYLLAGKYEIKINLTTNGTFPRKSMQQWAAIILPNTSDVKISWNGSTGATSQEIMKGINYSKAIENVKQLVALRDQHFNKTGYYCRISFQLTFMRNNVKELPGIIGQAAAMGIDRVKGHHLWAHFDEIKNLSMHSSAKAVEEWNIAVEEAFRVQERSRRADREKVILENILPIMAPHSNEVPEHYNCPFLGKELWISATGKISPCCAPDVLRQALGDFGNIADKTLDSIMKSDDYGLLVSRYKTFSVCKTCNMRKP